MKKILIIEDTAEVLENLAELLYMEGYEVMKASNGLEGINAIHHTRPDLIITDLRMPHMDGFAFLEAFRKMEQYTDVPVLVFSANATTENETHSLALGAAAFIKKPCSTEVLLKIISNTLQRS